MNVLIFFCCVPLLSGISSLRSQAVHAQTSAWGISVCWVRCRLRESTAISDTGTVKVDHRFPTCAQTSLCLDHWKFLEISWESSWVYAVHWPVNSKKASINGPPEVFLVCKRHGLREQPHSPCTAIPSRNRSPLYFAVIHHTHCPCIDVGTNIFFHFNPPNWLTVWMCNWFVMNYWFIPS